MADAYSCTKSHNPVSDQNKENPSKFQNHFLYKIALVIVFLVILPLFPSQAPEFINQTVVSRSWELLRLIFVGIAVSYGLFSRRNDEKEKETTVSKFDNAQSYVSRFLQVSSVFDDEAEIASSVSSDESKVQTWSNLYYRNEPDVVVTQEPSVFDEQRVKPLLLPVRSLKSRVPDADVVESSTDSLSSSNLKSSSKRFSSGSFKIRNEEFRGVDYEEYENDLDENFVLRSPVPWRSRSGKLEMKKEIDEPSPSPSPSRSPFMEEYDLKQLESSSPKSPSMHPSRPNYRSVTQKLSAEDSVWKKTFHKSSPPPPPPPPPTIRKISSMKPPSPRLNHEGVSLEKDLRRSFTSEPTTEPKCSDGLSMGKSVRTVRSAGETSIGARKVREIEEKEINGVGRKSIVAFNQEEEFADKVVMESDEDSETEEDDDIVGASFIQKDKESSSGDNKGYVCSSSVSSDGGPDVDKKADEFIAKFREQIRLQRIESIKRSSGQINKSSFEGRRK